MQRERCVQSNLQCGIVGVNSMTTVLSPSSTTTASRCRRRSTAKAVRRWRVGGQCRGRTSQPSAHKEIPTKHSFTGKFTPSRVGCSRKRKCVFASSGFCRNASTTFKGAIKDDGDRIADLVQLQEQGCMAAKVVLFFVFPHISSLNPRHPLEPVVTKPGTLDAAEETIQKHMVRAHPALNGAPEGSCVSLALNHNIGSIPLGRELKG